MRKKYIILVLGLLHTLTAWSLPGVFRNLSMSDGLSDVLVNAIYKDSVGYVWLGTANCLDRFDGSTVKHYRFDAMDVNKMRVNAILETSGGHLWCGNGLGIWRLTREEEALQRVFRREIDCPVQALAVNSEGHLLIGTTQGLYVRERDSLKHVLLDKNTLSLVNSIIGVNIDDNGIVWLATRQGLVAWQPENDEITHYQYEQQDSPFNRLSGITRIGRNLYLGTTHAGLLKFDISRRTFSRYIEVGNGIISAVSSDGKDLLYVATDGAGIHFVSQSANKVVNTIRYNPDARESIHSNSVYSLLVDRDGIIWVGMYSAGLDYSLYQRDIFHVYSFGEFTSRNLPVRSFYIHEGEKLVGTREGLFYISESTGQVYSFKKEAGISCLRSNLILSLFYYQGLYYVGTFGGGLSLLNPQTLTFRDFYDSETFTKGHVFHFQMDKEGNLWIATSEGVHRYDRNMHVLKTYNTGNSQLPEGNVYFILFDRSGKGWIATDNGLAIFDPATQTIKARVFPSDFVASKERIRYIYEASDGNLYFIPDKGNYFVSDPDMEHYGYVVPGRPMPGSSFLSVIEDEEGNIWASRNNGIVRGDPQMKDYVLFNDGDGLPDPAFIALNSFKDKNGVLWWGNAKGLLYVDPRKIDSLKSMGAPVVVTDLYFNGSPANTALRKALVKNETIELEHYQRNIRFRFVSLSYSNPETMEYEYCLEGRDTAWVQVTGSNEALYYNLPSGKYTFRVRVPMSDAVEKIVRIRIKPLLSPFYWAVILGVVAGVAGFSYRIYKRRKKQRDEYRRLLQREHEVEEERLHPEDREDQKYKNARLREEEFRLLGEKLLTYMEYEKPYINPDLKLSDLAQAIGCSSHALSQVFNLYLHKSYYDFVNDYRIHEFKVLVNDSSYAKYTLTALSEKSGFSSRASFFRSFKKSTGITPNEYIREIGKGRS